MKITINGNDYNALLANAIVGDVRYYLGGIYVDIPARALVATDGHALLRVPMTSEDDGHGIEPMIYAATARAPKGGEVIIDTETDNAVFFLKSGKEKRREVLTRIDGKFPDYGRVIPDVDLDQPETHDLAFNPELISRTTRELSLSFGMVTLHQNAKNDAMIVRIRDRLDLTLVVMSGRY